MKTTLVRFYFLFMLVSIGLFSFESKSMNAKYRSPEERSLKKETSDQNSKGSKRTYRHYFRYSNLC